MKRNSSFLSTLIVFSILSLRTRSFVSSSSASVDDRARIVIEQADNQYRQIFQGLKDRIWTDNYLHTVEEISEAVNRLSLLKHFASEVRKEIRQFSGVQNATLRRQIRNLRNTGALALQGAEWEAFESVLHSFKSYSTSRELCPYRHSEECDLAYLPNVRSIFTNSLDPVELKHYWLEFRDKIGPNAKLLLDRYVDLYRKSAQINAMSPPSHQYYYNFDSDNFLQEMESVMDNIRPLYLHFHAHVRHILRRKYGENVVPQRAPIPQNLIDQIILQAWKKNSLLEHPYPQKRLPNVKEKLDQQKYTPLKIVEVANEFFTSLGLPDLPETFWSKYARQIPNTEAGPDCKSELFDFFPDVALKYCPKPNYKKFLQMHKDMGVLHYNVQKNKLPLGLNSEPCTGFAKSLGEAAILAAQTPKHSQTISLLSDYHYDEELNVNRLFRQGIHTLFSIPAYFVHEKLFVAILDGKLSPQEYNCKYWSWMNQYMGVKPPISRTGEDFDVSYRFYQGMHPKNPHHLKFINEILGYQIYKGLCEKSGQYVKGNRDRPLQNCDFYGSAKAGQYIHEIMLAGARKSWREILEPLTGTNKLSGDGLNEFFEPIRIWLEEQNEKHSVDVGWTSDSGCNITVN